MSILYRGSNPVEWYQEIERQSHSAVLLRWLLVALIVVLAALCCGCAVLACVKFIP